MINNTIGKYKIIRLIGEGGMASIYEAEHEMLGTKVAIKVLNPILSSNVQIRERFRNEAKLMASLDHPNITKVIDFDEQPQQLSIIMEFLNGEELNQKIKKNGPLSEKEITELFSQTLSAFQYAHEKGIIHRDIKPSNIFILSNGNVKILDFGIAKLFGQGIEMTQTGAQIGTPVYMSPEQVKADKSIDQLSDIYSLGVTMFYAINGKPPYNSNTDSQFDIFTKIVYEPLPAFSVQSKFNWTVFKACQKKREERFQSCNEWLSVLKNPTKKISNNEKTVVENSNVEDTKVDQKKPDNIFQLQISQQDGIKAIIKPNKKKNILIFSIIGMVFIIVIILILFKSEIGPSEDLEPSINNELNGKTDTSLVGGLDDTDSINPPLKITLLNKERSSTGVDDQYFKDKYGLSGKNKPNGFMYRVREDNGIVLPKGNKTNHLKLFISERIESGYVSLARNGLGSDNYEFYVIIYDNNKNIIEEINLNEISGITDCEIQDIRVYGGHIYFNQACVSYSNEQGGYCSYLFSYNIKNKSLDWKTNRLTSNGIFLVEKDYIISGYGFTQEKDYIFLINRKNGQLIDKYLINSDPQYMEMHDGNLFVVDYNGNVYTFKVE